MADGVYCVPGARGDSLPANGGRLGNTGFIVGPRGVIVIDTGVSYRQGQDLLAAVARVTTQPVRLVLLTHTRQEFVFGAAAFQDRGIPVWMHADAARLMAARCETCLKQLRRQLGDAVMQDTRLVTPRPWRAGEPMPAAELIGRPVQVLDLGHANGPGNLAVLDTPTGTLFAGGVVAFQRIPDLIDSDLPGWHRALTVMQRLAPRHLVPGHGPATDAAALGAVRRYLEGLDGRVRELLAAGASLSDTPDRVSLAEFQRWDQYETVHRRNASALYLRLERDGLLALPAAAAPAAH